MHKQVKLITFTSPKLCMTNGQEEEPRGFLDGLEPVENVRILSRYRFRVDYLDREENPHHPRAADYGLRTRLQLEGEFDRAVGSKAYELKLVEPTETGGTFEIAIDTNCVLADSASFAKFGSKPLVSWLSVLEGQNRDRALWSVCSVEYLGTAAYRQRLTSQGAIAAESLRRCIKDAIVFQINNLHCKAFSPFQASAA